MASEKDASCANDPNFAIICGFLQKFSSVLNVQHPETHLLQEWLENTDEVPPGLKELHIKLLRKLRKTVHEKAWETALGKFCYTYSSQDAWEIERFGYKKSSLKVKLRILKEILECQFERNGKFRTNISALSAEELRGQPIGRDKLGHAYWLTQDPSCNLRIYQEHLDEEIWQVVASNRDELVTLINRLKGNEVVLPSLLGVVDEDSSSNSCSLTVRPPPPEEIDESTEDRSNDEKVPNIKIKLDSCTIERSQNDNSIASSKEDETDEESEETDTEDLDDFKEIEQKRNVNRIEKSQSTDKTNKDVEDERRVKPIVISQSKISQSNEEKPFKKRILDEDCDEEKDKEESENRAKKPRPTLLDSNREKKVSRYEKYNTEEESDDEDDEGAEEEEEEIEPEIEGDEEEDIPTEEEDNGEVSEEIEERILIVKGEGSGKDCKSVFLDLIQIGCEKNENLVGEEIEEEVLYFNGEGSGNDCLVGNSKDEPNKTSFFFGQPGCLKLSPTKRAPNPLPNKNENTSSKESNTNELKNNKDIEGNASKELKNGENSDEEKVKDNEIFSGLLDQDVNDIKTLQNNSQTSIPTKENEKQNIENVEKPMVETILTSTTVVQVKEEVIQSTGKKIEKEVIQSADKTLEKELIKAIDKNVEEEVIESIEKKVEKQVVESKDKKIEEEPIQSIDKKVEKEIIESTDIKLEKEVVESIDKTVEEEPIQSIDKKVEKGVVQSTDKKIEKEIIESIDKKVEKQVVESIDTRVEEESIQSIDKKVETGVIQSSDKKVKKEVIESIAKIVEKEVVQSTDKKVEEEPIQSSDKKVKKEVIESIDKKVEKEVVQFTDKKVEKEIIQSIDKKVEKQVVESIDKRVEEESIQSIDKKVETGVIQSTNKKVEKVVIPSSAKKVKKEVIESIDKKVEKEVGQSTDKKVEKGVIPSSDKKVKKEIIESIDKKVEKEVGQSTDKKVEEEPIQSIDKKVEKEVGQSTDKKVEKGVIPSSDKKVKKEVIESIAKKVEKEVVQSTDKKVEEEAIQSIDKKVETGVIQSTNKKVEKVVIPSSAKKVKKEIIESIDKKVEKGVIPTSDKKVEKDIIDSIDKKVKKEISESIDKKVEREVVQSTVKKVEKEIIKSIDKKVEKEVVQSTDKKVEKEKIHSTDNKIKEDLIQSIEKKVKENVGIKLEKPGVSKETLPVKKEVIPHIISIPPIAEKNISSNRKRRLSEEKIRHISESETDFNSENIEENIDEDEDQDIGGKRPKMRAKIVNANVRKNAEEKRKHIKKEDSSSEDEGSKRKQIAKMMEEKTVKVKVENKPENLNEIENKKEFPVKLTEPELKQIDMTLKLVETTAKTIIITPNLVKTTSMIIEASKPSEDIKTEKHEIEKIAETVGESSKPVLTIKNIPEPLPIDVTSAKPKAKSTPARKKGKGKRKPSVIKKTPVKPIVNAPTIEEAALEKIEEMKNLDFEEKIDALQSSSKPPKLEKIEINKIEETDPLKEPAKPTPKKVQQRRKREIDTSNIIETESDLPPVRQSRRIAQLKIREEAERRKLEEIALKKMKADLKKKKKENHVITIPEPEISEPSEPSEKEELDSEAEFKKKLEKKKRGIKNVKKGGWSSGSDDETEKEEEYELPYYESDRISPLVLKSDHEFSPESEIEDESQMVPLKRARTARKEGEVDDIVENLDEACQKCGKKDHPEWILLCDKCDKGYHCSCLIPVLFIIPEGDWYCPVCQQEQLIESLESHLKDYDDLLQKRKEEEELREHNLEVERDQAAKELKRKTLAEARGRNRRRSFDDDGDDSDGSNDGGDRKQKKKSRNNKETQSSRSSTTSSSSSSSSSPTDSDDEPIYKLRKRRQINVSYRFNEYDDLINSAIKEEMDEVAGAGNLGRGKDISTIIEADKEEKMRMKQLEAKSDVEDIIPEEPEEEKPVELKETKSDIPDTDVKTETEFKEQTKKEDSGSDFEPIKRKSKSFSRSLKKKNRKLNSLEISSDDDASDEDFKTSSYETDEDEESMSDRTESDSSLEIYRRKNKKNKKGRKTVRRAARERRRIKDFVVDDSEGSEDIPKTKKKRKEDSDYTESLSEDDDELSEDVDSEDLCDDTTSESDGAWRPSKRKKQKTTVTKIAPPPKKPPGKTKKNKRKDYDEDGTPYKAGSSNKIRENFGEDDDDDSESARRTRGKRFTYLEDYDDESSDDGIKPGVKRPDTPPEEREKFIKRQEEIKRMLAEKNTEAAKAAATPTLTPIKTSEQNKLPPPPGDSLSTVPLSVIKSAKALDIDYLQRKGELESDDNESEFDDDLPEDFNPEDMDEEEIAKMMEEEDFAQQQLKLAGEAIRQKKIKDMEQINRTDELLRVPRPTGSQLIHEPVKKRLPMPTIQPLLSNAPPNRIINTPGIFNRNIPLNRTIIQHPVRPPMTPPTILSVQSNSVQAVPPVPPSLRADLPVSPLSLSHNQSLNNDLSKPRGRRKKITPLRDTLQKQQAAAAAALAKQSSSPPLPDKPIQSLNLSVAQPPQLYKPPINTQPSVITRMPQPPRPRFPDQGSRFYPPPSQLLHRPPSRHSALGLPPRHALRPSFGNGPPPLRPANNGPPPTIGNGINRHPPPRQLSPFATADQYPPRASLNTPTINAYRYRPPLYGTPGYPPAPLSQSPSSIHSGGPDYQVSSYGHLASPFGNYYSPSTIGSTHSTPTPTPPPPPPPPPSPQQQPPPTVSAIPSSVIVSPNSLVPTTKPPQVTVSESLPPPIPRPKPLETFDSKSTPPLLETESTPSPYSSSAPTDCEENETVRTTTNSTSEFSGLVSYFSSQQDDFNT